MKLIADSGATKTEWVALKGNQVIERFTSKGFNPFYISAEEIERLIKKAISDTFPFNQIQHVYFYGTGCSTKENCGLVESVLLKFFPKAAINVFHDLQGAAVALLKKEKGIACILGTGSNSCLWDGEKIVENVPSLGYMIGDEGSAVYLGKLLLKRILSGKVDADVTKSFYKYAGMNFQEVLHKIYKDPVANQWIGGLSPFITENIHHPQIKGIAKKNFQDFIDNMVSEYSGFRELEISFLGSVAYYLQDLLKEVMKENSLKTGVILQSPMNSLIEFYSGNDKAQQSGF